jgi:hypothetical protein
MHAAMMKPSRAAAPTIAPMTMPAMAPPDRPEGPAAAALVDPVGAAVAVVVKSGGIVVVVGSCTPTQRASTLELTQHESVEFWELVEQNAHRPGRFVEKPHSSGSLSTAGIQAPLNALSAC